MTEMYFPLKNITFFGRRTKILCQNENGPCPLLAIANVMILHNRINFHPDISFVSLSEVIQEVGNLFLDSSVNNSNNAEVINVVDDALKILPNLARGLDLNIKFSDVASFEYTEELTVFDALGISPYHAWIIDDQDAMKQILHNMSYNNLVFMVANYRSIVERTQPSPLPVDVIAPDIDVRAFDHTYLNTEPNMSLPSENKSQRNEEAEISNLIQAIVDEIVSKLVSTSQLDTITAVDLDQDIVIITQAQEPVETEIAPKPELSESDQDLITMGSLYEDFLSENSTQMTYVGLLKLYETINEKQISILFHNNHFSTIFKFEAKIYLLVTDVGYKDEEMVAWELLDEINGNTVFADSNFQILQEESISPAKESSISLGLLEVNQRLAREGGGSGRYGETLVKIPDHMMAEHAASTPTSSSPPSNVRHDDTNGNDDADFQLALRLQQEEEMQLQAEANAMDIDPPPQPTSQTQVRIPSPRATQQQQPAPNSIDQSTAEQQRAYEYYHQMHIARQQDSQSHNHATNATNNSTRPIANRPAVTQRRQSNQDTSSNNNCIIS